jgi:hypothetical protein
MSGLAGWAAGDVLAAGAQRGRVVFVLGRHRRGPCSRLSELASFFGQLEGLAFSFVEAFGVGPANVSAGDAVEDCDGVAGTSAGAGSLAVHES